MVESVSYGGLPEELAALLRLLRVRKGSRVFEDTACGVLLVMARPERLKLVTKGLYPEIARRNQTNWKAVEHNIRHLIERVWKEDPSLLQELAGRPLTNRPTATQFLQILAGYLLERGVRAGQLYQEDMEEF